MENMLEPDQKMIRVVDFPNPNDNEEEQVNPPDLLVTGDNIKGNPFENPVVVMRFFELCDKSDLPTFRLVSKEWYKLSLKRFREEMQVKISLRENDEEHPLFMAKSKTLDWGQLDELPVGVEGGVPWRSFRLFDLSVGLREPAEPSPTHLHILNMELFWRKFGEWIYKLEFVHTRVVCMKSFEKAITEDTPNLQVLKLISVGLDRNYREGDESMLMEEAAKKQFHLTSISAEGYLPFSWKWVFSHFPNIQKFELNLLRSQCDDDGLSPLIDTLEQDTFQKLTITHLSLGITDGDDVGNVAERFLKLPQLKLDSLTLLLEGYRDNDRLMRHAATASQYHAPTLKKLRLFRWRPVIYGGHNVAVQQAGVDLPLHLTLFPRLAELELDGGFCRNFHFLEAMPNLKVLRMGRCFNGILEETDMARVGNVTLAHLREFQFEEVEITELAMEMFVKVMPNLERLYACFGKESLRVAFGNLGNLRELEIEVEHKWLKNEAKWGFAKIGDEGITGIEAGHETRYPNITNLKYLHRLKLTNVEGFSDVSVWEGFLKLQHLHTLAVTLSTETSDEAFSALVERFPGGGVKRLPIQPLSGSRVLFFPHHRLVSYSCETGFERRARQMSWR